MKTLILLLVTLPIFAMADDFPRDVAEVISKLERFEAEELDKANKAISDKRSDVADFLETALERETKSGNLDTAVALRKKIEQMRDSKNALSFSSPSGTAPQATGHQDLNTWIETVEIHDASGRWVITDTEVIQYSNKGGTKNFKRIKNDQDPRISFEASGTIFTLEIDKDRSKGIRTSEKFSAIPFTVKPKQGR